MAGKGIVFKTTIKRFASQGEKTGWTYIEVSAEQADKLMPGNKKGFQVKGKLDNYIFSGLNLLPMGEGNFILALNAAIRKAIGKKKGDSLEVQMQVDEHRYQLNKDLLECLAEEPLAQAAFNKMPLSHKNYYSKWIDSAKTDATQAKRIAMTVNAMLENLDFGAMLRKAREEKDLLGR